MKVEKNARSVKKVNGKKMIKKYTQSSLILDKYIYMHRTVHVDNNGIDIKI